MRAVRNIFAAATVLCGSAAAADISADMQSITQFCSHYVQTSQMTNLLMQNGFEHRRGEFRKSYNSSVIGGTQPVINVEARESRSGLGCSATFGIVGRNDGSRLISIAQQTLRQLGYSETPVTGRNGRRETAFVLNGIAVKLGGRTDSSHSSYSSFIFFQRLN
ncbi:hypothetical protein OCA8868_01877 [Octadecabacter ascidiaceicola]|uniref:Uncharacterized protein n=1 Tax=Octadecabacter ascidiaceicola TaxID=1655543 RepID=A0A238K9N7_9RHOB|nr:hypothetical protein OCA8868_01877 [Octadecabacter ascidiaceicola]